MRRLRQLHQARSSRTSLRISSISAVRIPCVRFWRHPTCRLTCGDCHAIPLFVSLARAFSDDEGHAVCEALQIAASAFAATSVCQQARQSKADGGQSHEEVRFRSSDRHRRYLRHSVRSIPEGPTSAGDRGWGGGWTIAESGTAPGWSITPAHAHMW
jgi:hypothetical protein